MTLDYHSAEAVRTDETVVDDATWSARCKCGWDGPTRERKADADDDALAHDIAENA